MKILFALPLLLLLTACTHYSVSNVSLLHNEPVAQPAQTQPFLLNIDADKDCYSSRVGQSIRTTCSNKGRIQKIVAAFKEQGLAARPPQENQPAPTISVKVDSINSFVEYTTGFFNIITLGLSPLYHYDDYIVTYKDAENGVEITDSVRVSSYSGWFSLFMSNPEDLGRGEIKLRAEKNLIRSVVSEIKTAE